MKDNKITMKNMQIKLKFPFSGLCIFQFLNLKSSTSFKDKENALLNPLWGRREDADNYFFC